MIGAGEHARAAPARFGVGVITKVRPYKIWCWGEPKVFALSNNGKAPLFMVSPKSVTIRDFLFSKF